MTRVAGLLIARALVLHLAAVRPSEPSNRDPRGVSNSSEALVPNATVTLTELNWGTGVDHVAKTDPSGSYILRALRSSSYVLKIQAPDFQAVEQQGIVLQVNQQDQPQL